MERPNREQPIRSDRHGAGQLDCGLALHLLPLWLGRNLAQRIEHQLAAAAIGPFRDGGAVARHLSRSEEHTSELQSLMRISYAVFFLKKKKHPTQHTKQDI